MIMLFSSYQMNESGIEGWSRLLLGASALDYLKGRLGNGSVPMRPGLPLRRALLEQLSIENGIVWTWAPHARVNDSIDPDGRLPTGTSQEGELQMIALFLKQYLEVGGRLAIMEDHDASATDPWPENDMSKEFRITNGTFLYWYAADAGIVDPMLESGLGLFTCIALTRPTPNFANGRPTQISDSDFVEMARATEHLVVDAFDFEGFIIWSRHGE